ncbi:hypothetical protein BGE01nite_45560 [Brevifollis gellanilyticus]|uniref:Uncharacterized protein n=2 Tax=Brevifollis gellanilyticus TaxID=748831 RepID=A0A512MEV1_9BACT|nr:hypothetical protein BGE01nite_45560 [Brevifollis gellanilyticus]
MGMFRDSFMPVFHGQVEATPEGSRIRGRMSHHLLVQIFHGFWCGALVLMALFFVWTIVMPLAAYGMLWIANGIMAVGDRAYPGREQKIESYLREVCERGLIQ